MLRVISDLIIIIINFENFSDKINVFDQKLRKNIFWFKFKKCLEV